jgi:hypothetical protein
MLKRSTIVGRPSFAVAAAEQCCGEGAGEKEKKKKRIVMGGDARQRVKQKE